MGETPTREMMGSRTFLFTILAVSCHGLPKMTGEVFQRLRQCCFNTPPHLPRCLLLVSFLPSPPLAGRRPTVEHSQPQPRLTSRQLSSPNKDCWMLSILDLHVLLWVKMQWRLPQLSSPLPRLSWRLPRPTLHRSKALRKRLVRPPSKWHRSASAISRAASCPT